jgi:uncharacterized protein
VHPSITRQLDVIAAACRRFGVRRLDLFGSAVRDDFDPHSSDVDFVVDFGPAADALLPRYFGLKSALEAAFGRDVDLVELPALRSQRLRRLIEHSRVPIYGSAP